MGGTRRGGGPRPTDLSAQDTGVTDARRSEIEVRVERECPPDPVAGREREGHAIDQARPAADPAEVGQ